MKLKYIIPLVIAAATAVPANAQSFGGIRAPMTQAVLQVYEEELQQNPNNYEVLLNRAEEYFRHEEYIRALADLDRAILIIPGNETETRLHALMLRAGIYNQTNRTAQALSDLIEAERLAPNNYRVILQKANTELAAESYAEAKLDYQRLIRLNSRSAEAYIGLARVAVKENNMGVANEMLASAVNIDPNNTRTYLQRASVRKAMNNHNGAVDDIVLALSIDPQNTEAISALLEYGDTHYPAAMNGLSNAVIAAPRVGMYRYLRAELAQSHFHYLAALQDYETIISERIYNYHGIYASMAQCQFALGRFEQALENIDYALGMVRDQTSNYYILRSRILRALGRYDEALRAAHDASAADRNSGDALAELALAFVANGRYEEASVSLGEAALNDAENPRYPMLRGWIQETYLNNPSAAAIQYRIVADMDHFYLDNPRSLKGFALLSLGERAAADRWMENILNTVSDHDGYVNYIGACYWAQAGDSDKALECTQKSLELGFGNYFDWMELKDGRVNIGGLRDDLRFLRQINAHNSIFGIE